MFSPFCHGEDYGSIDALAWTFDDLGMGQNHVPLVNLKIAGKPGKWMFIPLQMVLIGIDPCVSLVFLAFAPVSMGSPMVIQRPGAVESAPSSDPLKARDPPHPCAPGQAGCAGESWYI